MTTTRQPSLIDTIFRLQELADYIVPFGIRAVSELHLADHLTNGPRTITDLATATSTHAPSLYRVLRALACKGIFTETQPHTFALTPLADLLRTDHPLSLADAYPFVIGDLRAWAEFGHTLRTGESAFEHVHGTGYYDYLAQNPLMGLVGVGDKVGAYLDKDAKLSQRARALYEMTPKKGPIGTMITVTYSGLGSSLYEGGASMQYDNHYVGAIMANWTV